MREGIGRDKIVGTDFEQRSWAKGRRAGCPESSGVYTAVNEHFEPDANEAGRPSAACNTVGLVQRRGHQRAVAPYQGVLRPEQGKHVHDGFARTIVAILAVPADDLHQLLQSGLELATHD